MAPVLIRITSGTDGFSEKISIKKGSFNHIAVAFDKGRTDKAFIYVNGDLRKETNPALLGPLFFETSKLDIGKGGNHSFEGSTFVPNLPLSGAIDEFRFFKRVKKQPEIRKYRRKHVFNEPSLITYFKFNEPSGSFNKLSTNSNLVLDYSGNGLHTKINNFSMDQRNRRGFDTPIKGESSEYSPVLFPGFNKTANLVSRLIASASDYDLVNPNLITKLIPKHYLFAEQDLKNFSTEDGEIDSNNTFSEDLPGKSNLPSHLVISSILYLWGERFDEMKMLVDEFGRFLNAQYQDHDSVSDQIIPHLARYYGFSMPHVFRKASENQLKKSEDVLESGAIAAIDLNKVQNTIWRRILSDITNIKRKKGTIAGIEAVLRNIGIEPGNPFKITEYGGSKIREIRNTFEDRKKNFGMFSLSGSNRSGIKGIYGSSLKHPIVFGPFMSGSRTERGVPNIRGNFVSTAGYKPSFREQHKNISNHPSDGLFTSGSWTFQATYKMPSNSETAVTQSLVKIQTTGSSGNPNYIPNNNLIYNLVATNTIDNSQDAGKIRLFGRPKASTNAKKLTDPILDLTLDVNIYDGENWTVFFGRDRNDMTGSALSSSYFLRAGRYAGSGRIEYYSTSSFFNDSGDNTLNTLSPVTNASGSFLVFGSMSLSRDKSNNKHYLNEYSELTNTQLFSGSVGLIKFFSKGITEKETKVHARNPASVGIGDPLVNSNFQLSTTGSFERLRYDLQVKQPITASDVNGSIQLFDFSQESNHAQGHGFIPSSQVVKPINIVHSILSPKFEYQKTTNKIRPRSYTQRENLRDKVGVFSAPLYEIPRTMLSNDDRRVSIEVSMVQALNDDIVNILSTLDFFDSAIGLPNSVFGYEYPRLRNLRRVYFNRLENKVSSKKFFEFFKWFDDTVGDIIEQMIPVTSRYLGTNFVVESHALERSKMVYHYQNMYVGELDRLETTSIFVNQFVCFLGR